MKFRTVLLGLLLSLGGPVLGFVSARKQSAHGFSVPPQQLAACGIHCGTERWSVKTLSDADREDVDFSPKKTTVALLVSQQSPAYLPADRRVAPVETQTYKVRASLVGCWPEQDEDIHLVIADLDHANKTMIVEIPSPDCAEACASGHVEDFRRARVALPEQFACLTVVLTEVGFFDFLHGQAGAAAKWHRAAPRIEDRTRTVNPSVPGLVTIRRLHRIPSRIRNSRKNRDMRSVK